MKIKMILTTFVVTLCFSCTAYAEVFLCEVNGKPVVQDTYCDGYVLGDKGNYISTKDYKKSSDLSEKRKKTVEEAIAAAEKAAAEKAAAEKAAAETSSSRTYYPNSSPSYYPSSSYSGGRTIHTGPRGGRYYYNRSGNKTYVRRK